MRFGDSRLPARFWSKVAVNHTTGCWQWTAYVRPNGYGAFGISGAVRRAHRISYQMLVGPVPERHDLDHLCRNRACVNPAHLEPVTRRENMRRGIKGVLTTHCPQGHPYVEGNIYWDGPERTHRKCATCVKARVARRKRHLREDGAS